MEPDKAVSPQRRNNQKDDGWDQSDIGQHGQQLLAGIDGVKFQRNCLATSWAE